MNITPDAIVYWEAGPVRITATLVFTWLVMVILVGGSWLVTRRLSTETTLSRGQSLLEIVVEIIQEQIRDVTQQDPARYLPFVGTLFLFIAVSNILAIIPGFHPPTGSLSTTAALALCVFVSTPLFGIAERGLGGFLKTYLQPSPFLLPFNIFGELTRTVALALRLFGNVMSGSMMVAAALAIAPLFFPIIMSALGLLIGLIQAYIFAILALVFIASANQAPSGAGANCLNQREKDRRPMNSVELIGMISIIMAGATVGIGAPVTAIAEGWAVSRGLTALAQQPDAAPVITRSMFIGVAMCESSAIYCFVVSIILIFANPFWNHVVALTGGQ